MIKILLIVDDWEALDRYEAELGAGFEAIPVFFGKDAIPTAGEARADAALIDLVLEECDGPNLERSFRQIDAFAALPIALILSEHDSDEFERGPAFGDGTHTRTFRRPFDFAILRSFFDGVRFP
jgi:DNA-binding response OmpR family regulator